MKRSDRKARGGLIHSYRLIFIVMVAGIMLVAASVVFLTLYFLLTTGVISTDDLSGGGIWIIALFVLASVIIGSAINAIFVRLVFRPISELLGGLEKLADGDYEARLKQGSTATQKELSEKFNSLAVQLENTTILRSDFINNFSHEFKTPIVSMKGLLSLLKRGDLSPTKRKQYLAIIEEELERLSTMSTNVLNLTKIENESILTNVTKFNLSEQIRTCLLLLEKKWSKKEIVFGLDFDEYDIEANEDLLKEVWINLLDNAIKFSFEGGRVNVDISENENDISVTLENGGEKLNEREIDKIFNKFYRGGSGKKEGNGIGLPIVKHIVSLHGGTITATAGDTSKFIVTLPKKQS